MGRHKECGFRYRKKDTEYGYLPETGKQPLWKGNVLPWKQDENRSSGIKGEGGEFQSGTVACEEESRAGREESEATAETEKRVPRIFQ